MYHIFHSSSWNQRGTFFFSKKKKKEKEKTLHFLFPLSFSLKTQTTRTLKRALRQTLLKEKKLFQNHMR